MLSFFCVCFFDPSFSPPCPLFFSFSSSLFLHLLSFLSLYLSPSNSLTAARLASMNCAPSATASPPTPPTASRGRTSTPAADSTAAAAAAAVAQVARELSGRRILASGRWRRRWW